MNARSRCRIHQRVIGTLLLMLHLSACTGWRTQQVTPEVLIHSRQPTKVRLTLTDRSRLVIYHPVVTADSLVGATYLSAATAQREMGNPSSSVEKVSRRIAFSDIGRIETRGFSPGRTALLGLGVGFATLAILAIGTAGILDSATPKY